MHPVLARRVVHPYLQWRTGSQDSPVLATGKLRRFVSRLVHPAVRHREEVPPRE